MDEKRICPWCYYSRMRTDICGIYCTGGFTNPDGTCDHFKNYDEVKREKRREQYRKRKERRKSL